MEKSLRILNCTSNTNVCVTHLVSSSNMPNKTSFPVSAFGATASLVLASRQSLILSFTTTYLPTPLLILPMLSVVSFRSVSTVLMTLMFLFLTMMLLPLYLSSVAPVMKFNPLSASLKTTPRQGLMESPARCWNKLPLPSPLSCAAF